MHKMDDVNWYTGQQSNRLLGVVSVSRADVSISVDLMRDWPENACWARLGMPQDRSELSIQPVSEQADAGCMAVQRCAGKSSARISAVGAWRFFGIQFKTARHFAARWRDGMIVAKLDVPTDRPAVPATTPKASADAPTMAPQASEGKPCCGTCRSGTELRGHPGKVMCDRVDNEHRRHLIPAGQFHNCWEAKQPQTAAKQPTPPAGALAAVGDKVICPKCETLHKVTNRGIYPHDDTGVEYRAGRGDPDRRCPGSGMEAARERICERRATSCERRATSDGVDE
jgi:hypothetical protein